MNTDEFQKTGGIIPHEPLDGDVDKILARLLIRSRSTVLMHGRTGKGQ